MLRLIFLATLCLPLTVTYAAPFASEPVPGGVAAIVWPDDADIATLRYRDRRILTVKRDQQTLALIGLSLGTKPGAAYLTGKNKAGKSMRLPFHISDKSYEEQHITIKDKRKVNPEKTRHGTHHPRKETNWQRTAQLVSP